MIKKIKLFNQFLKLFDAIQAIAKKNKSTFDEIFKILDKIKKVSPEIADIIANIKELLK